MSHIASRFLASTHTVTFPELLDLHQRQMWDAVVFTTTLDSIVDNEEAHGAIEAYLYMCPYTVVEGVLNDYMVSRGIIDDPNTVH